MRVMVLLLSGIDNPYQHSVVVGTDQTIPQSSELDMCFLSLYNIVLENKGVFFFFFFVFLIEFAPAVQQSSDRPYPTEPPLSQKPRKIPPPPPLPTRDSRSRCFTPIPPF